MTQPVTRLLTTPLGELFGEDDLDSTLRALTRVASSYRPPSHDLSLRQVLYLIATLAACPFLIEKI